ncbi:MAG: HD domain-containing phosphohydrolase [Bacillota bacterium]
MLVVTVLFILSTILITVLDTLEINKDFREKLYTVEQFSVLAITEPLWNYDPRGIQATVEALYSDKEIGYILIKDNYGKVLYENNRSGAAYEPNQLTYLNKGVYKSDKYIGNIVVGVSRYFNYKHFISQLYISIIQLCVFIVVLWFTINFISKIITQPILKVIASTERISRGDMTSSVDISSVDEIGVLASSVNKMQNDLKGYIEELHQRLDELNMKSSEIAFQKDEINALYEQAASMNNELNYYVEKLELSYKMTVLSLAKAIEANDRYTKGHCERVTRYCVDIAKAMKLNEDDITSLEFAALLHDIGKIGVPSNVLNKPDKLSDEEFYIIKQHPEVGCEIIKHIEFLQTSSEIVLQHHERYDGKGYPQGLLGSDVHICAKILSVADSYDAMTSSRPYRRQPLTAEQAKEQLLINKGIQFDPLIVDVFIDLLEKKIIDY